MKTNKINITFFITMNLKVTQYQKALTSSQESDEAGGAQSFKSTAAFHIVARSILTDENSSFPALQRPVVHKSGPAVIYLC